MMISYGNNIVASVTEKYRPIVSDYINRFPVAHCFETPNLHVVDDAMRKEGFRPAWVEATVKDISFVNEMNDSAALEIQT